MEVSFYVNLQTGAISFMPIPEEQVCGSFKQVGEFTITHMSIFSSICQPLSCIFAGWVKITTVLG